MVYSKPKASEESKDDATTWDKEPDDSNSEEEIYFIGASAEPRDEFQKEIMVQARGTEPVITISRLDTGCQSDKKRIGSEETNW